MTKKRQSRIVIGVIISFITGILLAVFISPLSSQWGITQFAYATLAGNESGGVLANEGSTPSNEQVPSNTQDQTTVPAQNNGANQAQTAPQQTAPSPQAQNDTQQEAAVVANLAMALVFDISGSMDESSGAPGKTKLESAKRQATDFVSAVQKTGSGTSGGISVQVGAASFSTSGRQDCPLSTNTNEINAAINALSAYGRTNMYAGIDQGIQMLGGFNGEKQMVLLSDGYNNEGHSDQDILDLAQYAAEGGIKIITIGFGANESDVDSDLLSEIARITGGTYSYENSADLTSAAVGLFGTMMSANLETQGEVLVNSTGAVGQGQTVSVTDFTVAENGTITTYLYWPGSTLDAILLDPQGTEVDESYPGATFDLTTIPTTITITNAMQGAWKMSVYGREVSMVNEPFWTGTVFTPTAPVATGGGGGGGDATGMLFLLLIVAIAAIGSVYALSVRKKNEQKDKQLYG